MKPRKTIPVADLKSRANVILAHSLPSEEATRQGVAALLEEALHMANAYRGFLYLPGNNPDQPDRDETRRRYL